MQLVENPPTNAGDSRDSSLIPGSGRSPGGGHGNPLQYSCLENPMDRGAWRDTAPGVTKSQTRLSTHALRPTDYVLIFKLIFYCCNIALWWWWWCPTKSCPTLTTPWTVGRQAPLSMGFSRQKYWGGLPFPSPVVL